MQSTQYSRGLQVFQTACQFASRQSETFSLSTILTGINYQSTYLLPLLILRFPMLQLYCVNLKALLTGMDVQLKYLSKSLKNFLLNFH